MIEDGRLLEMPFLSVADDLQRDGELPITGHADARATGSSFPTMTTPAGCLSRRWSWTSHCRRGVSAKALRSSTWKSEGKQELALGQPAVRPL
jgi:hypothetical protein